MSRPPTALNATRGCGMDRRSVLLASTSCFVLGRGWSRSITIPSSSTWLYHPFDSTKATRYGMAPPGYETSGAIDWKNGTEISFAALRESEGMMIPIEPPRCIGCDANRSRMYCSDSIPGVIMCADCQRQVTRVILGMGFDLDHPLLNELLSAEIRTWTNWDS
jgi:hypothetical protein